MFSDIGICKQLTDFGEAFEETRMPRLAQWHV
jgi:hypothetical protein